MYLRGIDSLSAAALCAEIGDFARFRHPEQLMSYLGVTPSEHFSGSQRRLGPITKSGSQHARRLLVEAARHYHRPPGVSTNLRRRKLKLIPKSGRCHRRAATTASRLGADGAARQAPHDHRRRRHPRARRLLLGGRHHRLKPGRHERWSEEAAGTTAGFFAQSTRDTTMGSRPGGDARC